MERTVKDVNVTELRQNLPAYLARVRRGERLRVTTRGQAIAEIAPPSPSAGEAQAARSRLQGSIERFERPLDPVFGPGEWEMER